MDRTEADLSRFKIFSLHCRSGPRRCEIGVESRLTMVRFGPIRQRRGRMALLTARAAAERLGVGYSTLKRWVRSGTVRTTRTEGGHHRVADSEIERLLAAPAARLAPASDHESMRQRRVLGRIECAESSLGIYRRGSRGRPARSSPPSSREPDAHRRDHRRCGSGAEASAGRGCDCDRQVDRSDDCATKRSF